MHFCVCFFPITKISFHTKNEKLHAENEIYYNDELNEFAWILILRPVALWGILEVAIFQFLLEFADNMLAQIGQIIKPFVECLNSICSVSCLDMDVHLCF
jgi:hypothetical protein